MAQMRWLVPLLALALAFSVLFCAAYQTRTENEEVYPEKPHGWDFQPLVQRYHDTLRGRDAAAVAKLFTSDGIYLHQEEMLRGRKQLQKYFSAFFSFAVRLDVTITSPVIANDYTVHFVARIFAMGKHKCKTLITSLERISFNEYGEIVSARSLWNNLPEEVEAELSCQIPPMAYATRMRKQKVTELNREYFHMVSVKELDGLTHLLAPNAVVDSYDATTLDGLVEIRRDMRKLIEKSEILRIQPLSEIFVGENTAASIASLFIVTQSGCVWAGLAVNYFTYNVKGAIDYIESYYHRTTYDNMMQELDQDCGGLDHIYAAAAADRNDPARAEAMLEQLRNYENSKRAATGQKPDGSSEDMDAIRQRMQDELDSAMKNDAYRIDLEEMAKAAQDRTEPAEGGAPIGTGTGTEMGMTPPPLPGQ